MTYNEKKSLYESIMKDVAKTVKRKINEMSNGLRAINNIEDITLDMFYDSKLNKSFHSFNDEFILYKPVTNEIGCDVNIRLFNSGENRTVSIWAPSLGELLESFYVVFKASYEEGIFSITTNRVIEVFKREWYRKLSYNAADETTILDTVRALKSKYDNNPPKTVKDVIKSINSVRDIKQEVDDYNLSGIDDDYNNGLLC